MATRLVATRWPALAVLLCCASAALRSQTLLRNLGQDTMEKWRAHYLAWSVNQIVDAYVGTRTVVMFADEVRDSDAGQRLLAGMVHARLLVPAANPRLANGLIVYLQEDGRATDYDAVLGRLPASDHSRHMVLWPVSRDRVDLHRVQVTFETFWQYQLVDVAVLVPMSTGSIRVYAFNPYAGSRCDRAGPPIMVNVWSVGSNAFIKPDRVFGMDDKLKDLHKYVDPSAVVGNVVLGWRGGRIRTVPINICIPETKSKLLFFLFCSSVQSHLYTSIHWED